MFLRFECKQDGCPALIEYRPLGQPEEKLNCPRCGRECSLNGADRLDCSRTVEQCVRCGGREFFIRKDFPQKTGVLIVMLAGAFSLYWLERNAALAYGVLVAAVAIDLFIYSLIGVVTVCYRCRAEYRGVPRHPEHDWFDLATSEKYL